MIAQETLENIEKQVNEYGFNGTLHITTDDYGVIKSALEKQIPKKPVYEMDGYDENGNWIYDIARCPICGREFEVDINDWGCDYCADCGQALDWSTDNGI